MISFQTVKNLNVSKYSKLDSFAENTTKQSLRSILKCTGHPSIQCESKTFCFTEVDAEGIKKEILKINKNTASQVSDIPLFPACLKLMDVKRFHKNKQINK